MNSLIPTKIEKLIYTKHARLEQFREEKGIIEFTPKAFYKVGCKSCNPERDGTFRAVYIYDDRKDLHLIINPVTHEVVTNFIKFCNNKGIYKGRFRFTRQ